MSVTIEVMPAGKQWGVYIDGELFGVQKNSYACDFAARMLLKVLDCATLLTHPELRELKRSSDMPAL